MSVGKPSVCGEVFREIGWDFRAPNAKLRLCEIGNCEDDDAWLPSDGLRYSAGRHCNRQQL